MDGASGWREVFRNWAWVFVGNLAGSLLYALLLWASLTMFGEVRRGAVADRIVAIAEAKTIAYAAMGTPGGAPRSSRRCCVTGWSAWAS